MAWRIEYTPKAVKEMSKLDKPAASRINRVLTKRIAAAPRDYGKALSGPLGEFWRYRIGDYRVLARLEDGRLVVLVVEVGHRSRVYKQK